MKVELIFIDSVSETKRGLYRGILIYILFVVLFLGWHWIFKSIYPQYIYDWKLWISILVFAFFFASAITVAHPKDHQTAIVYGALVGLTLFACVNTYLVAARLPISIAIFDIMFGILIGMLCAYIAFYL